MIRSFCSFTIFIMLSWTVISCTSNQDEGKKNSSTEAKAHTDPDGYYTCPMHPQVHEHKAGQCPICGMPLVKTMTAAKVESSDAKPDSEITISPAQLRLAGIGKYQVVRKDIDRTIPVSGRMVSSREVVFQVFESDIVQLNVGDRFSGSTSISPTDILKGQVRSIDSLMDPSSRTIRVTGLLEQSGKRFVAEGAFLGEISVSLKNQIAVPEEAVLHTGRGSLVYLFMKDQTLKATPVALGAKASGEYQVLSGLKEGDVISSGPNFLIDSEAKIRGSYDQANH